jgi:hypothetical protein
MATIGTVLNLIDVAKSLDPDGKVADVAEMLAQKNEMLNDIPWVMGNLPTGHRMTARTALPTVTARRLNEGVSPTKSRRAQTEEQAAIYEARNEIDVDLAKLNDNAKAFRLSEADAHVEAMAQAVASDFIYNNSGVTEEKVHGLAPRYASLSGVSSSHVIGSGGTGSDNTSIWLIGWGPNTIFGHYPKGSQAGLLHEDLGVIDAFDSNSKRFRAYADRWQWKCGLAVKDWRYAVRICNIDVSQLVGNASAADLIEKMILAMYRIPSLTACTPAFYCNRTVGEQLDLQTRRAVATGGQLGYMDVNGREVLSFRKIPIRISDAILETESAVS